MPTLPFFYIYIFYRMAKYFCVAEFKWVFKHKSSLSAVCSSVNTQNPITLSCQYIFFPKQQIAVECNSTFQVEKENGKAICTFFYLLNEAVFFLQPTWIQRSLLIIIMFKRLSWWANKWEKLTAQKTIFRSSREWNVLLKRNEKAMLGKWELANSNRTQFT